GGARGGRAVLRPQAPAGPAAAAGGAEEEQRLALRGGGARDLPDDGVPGRPDGRPAPPRPGVEDVEGGEPRPRGGGEAVDAERGGAEEGRGPAPGPGPGADRDGPGDSGVEGGPARQGTRRVEGRGRQDAREPGPARPRALRTTAAEGAEAAEVGEVTSDK